MTVTLRQGDARAVLATLPAASVHCVITSPPYWAQRKYAGEWLGGNPECDHKPRPSGGASQLEGASQRGRSDTGECPCGANKNTDKSIGNEKTPQEWCDALVEVFRGVKRVLRDDGTLFLNVGDKMDAKSLLGLPWMLAFALMRDGWILRQEVIWHKLSPMPESATDRPTRAHEQLFLFAKEPHYFWDAEAIRDEAKYGYQTNQNKFKSGTETGDGHRAGGGNAATSHLAHLGRNARSVQAFAPSPFSVKRLGKYGPLPEVDHFALFSISLPTWCIKAGTSEKGVCPECGAPWGREMHRSGGSTGQSWHDHKKDDMTGQRATDPRAKGGSGYEVTTTGWAASCEHDGAPVPATVLDPFSGAGTTGLAAHRLGRNYIGTELSQAYIDLSNARLLDDAPMLAGGQA